jgi:hypothetical protein
MAMNGVSKHGPRAEGSTAVPDLLAAPQWWVCLSARSLRTTHLTSFDILERSSRLDCQSGICRRPSLQARNRGCRESGEEEEIGHFSLAEYDGLSVLGRADGQERKEGVSAVIC